MQQKNSLLKKIISFFARKKEASFKKGRASFDLIIYDDLYPHPASGFRLEEITFLLNNIRNSKAVLSGNSYKLFKLPNDLHKLHIDKLIKENTCLSKKIEILHKNININCKLFYCIFLNNIYKNLEWVEKYRIPFAFTLYPGGGFLTDDTEVNNKLKIIFSSAHFRKVFVTQKKTYNYLLENDFCKASDILFVFGVVAPQLSLIGNNTAFKKLFKKDKESFDICFCASKYTKFGEDKGYPLFVEFMKAVAPKYRFIKFHIIGGFDKNVLDIEQIEDRIIFYGYQGYTELNALFRLFDLIISPNQPDKLGKGSFDGFPLGTVIEAALNEVLVMLTDCFNENTYFEDGKELIIIRPDLRDILNKFEYLIENLDDFYKIAKKGKAKFQMIYSNEYQMTPRTDIIRSLIEP